MSYLKALVCKALYREFSYYASLSDNAIDISFFEWKPRDWDGTLKELLQEEIDLIESGEDLHTSYPPYDLPFDGLLLGYGLCSHSMEGLSSKKYSLVIPRTFDCNAILLGSRERYDEETAQAPGTYWLNRGWMESLRNPAKEDHDWLSHKICKKSRGEAAAIKADGSDELTEGFARLAVIEWPEFADKEFYQKAKQATLESAEYLNLPCDILQGSSTFVKDMLTGNWDEERFLVVPPGETVKLSSDEGLITY